MRMRAKSDAQVLRSIKKATKLREQKKTFDEIAEILDITPLRARQLVARGERLDLELFQGKLIPPPVKLAMDRGGFRDPVEVRAALLDGSFRLTGRLQPQTTVDGIGKAKFVAICAFLRVNPSKLPYAAPAEVRIARAIASGEPIDQAVIEVIGNSVHLRSVLKFAARLTSQLTPASRKRFQEWGTSGP